MNKNLANLFMGLCKSYAKGEPFHLQKTLTLTKNEYNNCQKLKYWGLIEKHFKGGRRIGGCWVLTEIAEKVLRGGKIPVTVTTFNNKVVEASKEIMSLDEAVGFYSVPKVWAEKSKPVKGNDLF